MTGRIAVTVTVLPRPEPPTISGDDERSIEEGAAVPVWTYIATDQDSDDFIIWQPLEGADADLFTFTSVGSNGRLALRATPDFEENNTYNVTLAARGGDETARLPVEVTVTDKDEAGDLRLSSREPVVNAELIATVSDLDRVVSTAWTWERSTTRSGPWTTLTGADDSATESTYTPAQADLDHYLRVTATYDRRAWEGQDAERYPRSAGRSGDGHREQPPAGVHREVPAALRPRERGP